MEKLHKIANEHSWNRDLTAFINELRQFHQNRGTPFRHAPKVNGREVNLHTLYNQVTTLGGWQKVNDGHRWDIVLDALGLPTSCVNSNLALRQLYIRYLGAYEKIHFLGEDPDGDENPLPESRTRKQPTNCMQQVPMFYNQNQHELTDFQRSAVGMSQDFVYPKDYDKLVLSFLSGLPNEQDFALNVCTLLSNEGRHVLHLSKSPKLLDLLVAQTGVWPDSDPTLGKFYLECWKDVEGRQMTLFWESMLDTTDPDVQELWWCSGGSPEDTNDELEGLFNLRQKMGARNTEGQRILRIALILYNLSFEHHNIPELVKNSSCIKFLLLCVFCRWSYLRQIALDTLGNLAVQLKLTLKEDLSSKLVVRTITEGIDSSDRFVVLRSLEILGNLAQCDENDDVLACCIDLKVYQRILALLTLHDVMLMVYSLEALYSLSELGRRICEKILRVHKAVGTLVSLLTVDPQISGPGEGNFKLVETFDTSTTDTASSEPQTSKSSSTSQLTTSQNVTPATTSSFLSHSQLIQQSPLPTCSPSEIPLKRTAANPSHVFGPEVDSESVACSWLKAFYEESPGGSILRNELYADYVSYCSKVGRKCVVNGHVFSNCMKLVFPKCSILKQETNSGIISLHYEGLVRRQFPLPLTTVMFSGKNSSNGQYRPVSPAVQSSTGPGPPKVATSSDSVTPPPSSHSPILKAHLSSPLRSLTPPLTNAGVVPSPPASPGPLQGSNTNLIKCLLATKLSQNIKKQQTVSNVLSTTSSGDTSSTTTDASDNRTIYGTVSNPVTPTKSNTANGSPLAAAAASIPSNRVINTPKSSKSMTAVKCKNLNASLVSNEAGSRPTTVTIKPLKGKLPLRLNGIQRDFHIDGSEAKKIINHHPITTPTNVKVHNTVVNSESADKNLPSTSVLASSTTINSVTTSTSVVTKQNGLPPAHNTSTTTIIKKDALPQQFLIPVSHASDSSGKSNTTIPRIIVINNSSLRAGTDLGSGNTVLLQSSSGGFTTQMHLPITTNQPSQQQQETILAQGIVPSIVAPVQTTTAQNPIAQPVQDQLNEVNSSTDLLKTVLVSAQLDDCSDDLKRKRNEKPVSTYKNSPLLNGLLDKGKIPLPGEEEIASSATDSAKVLPGIIGINNDNLISSNGKVDVTSLPITKIEPKPKPVIVKEDILSTAMAFAELNEEPLTPEPTTGTGVDDQNISMLMDTSENGAVANRELRTECSDNAIDGTNILSSNSVSSVAVQGLGMPAADLSSITDITRTLECASKAINRTNAECHQLPFVAVPVSSAVSGGTITTMPGAHIVSVLRLNPQGTAITLPVMTGGPGVGQQILQAHIVRLQSPTMSLKMGDGQEVIRLPQLTAGQLAQLQIQTSGGNSTNILGSTIVASAGNTLKRPNTAVGTPTACYILETKRPRQDLVGDNQTVMTNVQGLHGTKTPLLEASLRQSGLTVITAPQQAITSLSGGTQVVTVPAVMSADGQIKQQAQTFHLTMQPKLQPKPEPNCTIVSSTSGTSTTTIVRTVALVSSCTTQTTNTVVNFMQQNQPIRLGLASNVTSRNVSTSSSQPSPVTPIQSKPNTVRPALIASKVNVSTTKATVTSSIATSTTVATTTAATVKTETKPIISKDAKPTVSTAPPQQTPPTRLKFICEWKNCLKPFSTAPAVLFHVAKEHMPEECDTEAVCEWENCDNMKRKKLSLLTHMQDRHCTEHHLHMQAVRRHQMDQFGKSNIPPNQPPPPHPGYAPDAALLAIRRHALQYLNPKEFVEEKEGSLTKSIRLTASLVLRNLVIYCPSACSGHLRQYESELACLAMSNIESSRTLAQCLLELARPTSSIEPSSSHNTMTTFVPGDFP